MEKIKEVDISTYSEENKLAAETIANVFKEQLFQATETDQITEAVKVALESALGYSDFVLKTKFVYPNLTSIDFLGKAEGVKLLQIVINHNELNK